MRVLLLIWFIITVHSQKRRNFHLIKLTSVSVKVDKDVLGWKPKLWKELRSILFQGLCNTTPPQRHSLRLTHACPPCSSKFNSSPSSSNTSHIWNTFSVPLDFVVLPSLPSCPIVLLQVYRLPPSLLILLADMLWLQQRRFANSDFSLCTR